MSEYKKRWLRETSSLLSALVRHTRGMDMNDESDEFHNAYDKAVTIVRNKKSLPIYPRRVEEMLRGMSEKFRIHFLDEYADELERTVDDLRCSGCLARREGYTMVYVLMLLSGDPTGHRPQLSEAIGTTVEFIERIREKKRMEEERVSELRSSLSSTGEFSDLFKEWMNECLEESDITDDSEMDSDGDSEDAAVAESSSRQKPEPTEGPRVAGSSGTEKEMRSVFVDIYSLLGKGGYLTSIIGTSSASSEAKLALAAALAAMGVSSDLYNRKQPGESVDGIRLQLGSSPGIEGRRSILEEFELAGRNYESIGRFCDDFSQVGSTVIAAVVEGIRSARALLVHDPLDSVATITSASDGSTGERTSGSHTLIGVHSCLSNYIADISVLADLCIDIRSVIGNVWNEGGEKEGVSMGNIAEAVSETLSLVHGTLELRVRTEATCKGGNRLLALLLDLYNVALLPYAAIIDSLLHGRDEVDRFGEVFIRAAAETESGTEAASNGSDGTGHTVCIERRAKPPRIFEKVAWDIFSAVRTANYLLGCGREDIVRETANSQNFFASQVATMGEKLKSGSLLLSDLTFPAYLTFLTEIADSMLSSFISQVLFGEYRLDECIASIWDVYLLRLPESGGNFVKSISQQLDVEGIPISYTRINRLFLDSLPSLAEGVIISIQLPEAVGAKKSVATHAEYVKSFFLRPTFTSPMVRRLFPAHILRLYQSVNMLLADLERTNFLVGLAHECLGGLASGRKGCGVRERKALIALAFFREYSRVLSFYLRGVVIGPSTSKFTGGLTEYRTLEEIEEAHLRFVKNLVNNCFLSAQFQPILRRMTSILHSASTFSIVCLHDVPKGEYTREICDTFTESMKHLVNVLKSFAETTSNAALLGLSNSLLFC